MKAGSERGMPEGNSRSPAKASLAIEAAGKIARHFGLGGLGALILAASVAGCGGPQRHGDRPPPVVTSPNGQPLDRSLDCATALGRWFAAADLDHDGTLDLAEFKADAARLFASIDLDHDGYLTSSEIEAMRRQARPDIAQTYETDDTGPAGQPQPGAPPGHGGGGGEGHHHHQSGGGAPQAAGQDSGRGSSGARPDPIMEADTNLDNRVSADEFQALAVRRFTALDSGHAGRIVLDQVTHVCVAGERGGRG